MACFSGQHVFCLILPTGFCKSLVKLHCASWLNSSDTRLTSPLVPTGSIKLLLAGSDKSDWSALNVIAIKSSWCFCLFDCLIDCSNGHSCFRQFHWLYQMDIQRILETSFSMPGSLIFRSSLKLTICLRILVIFCCSLLFIYLLQLVLTWI